MKMQRVQKVPTLGEMDRMRAEQMRVTGSDPGILARRMRPAPQQGPGGQPMPVKPMVVKP